MILSPRFRKLGERFWERIIQIRNDSVCHQIELKEAHLNNNNYIFQDAKHKLCSTKKTISMLCKHKTSHTNFPELPRAQNF